MSNQLRVRGITPVGDARKYRPWVTPVSTVRGQLEFSKNTSLSTSKTQSDGLHRGHSQERAENDKHS